MVTFLIMLIVLIPTIFFIYKRAVNAWEREGPEEQSGGKVKSCCTEQPKESPEGDRDNVGSSPGGRL